MQVNLMTDAGTHNLALMKISTYHKQLGDTVCVNGIGEKTYGSWLYDFTDKVFCDEEGGPAIDPAIRLPEHIEKLRPDYDLFPIEYSLGYTWEYCPRRCEFCKVHRMNPPKVHHSIWDFHDEKFK